MSMASTFDLHKSSHVSTSHAHQYGDATREKIREAKSRKVALKFAIKLQLRNQDRGFEGWRQAYLEDAGVQRKARRVVRRMQQGTLARAVSQWLFEYERCLRQQQMARSALHVLKDYELQHQSKRLHRWRQNLAAKRQRIKLLWEARSHCHQHLAGRGFRRWREQWREVLGSKRKARRIIQILSEGWLWRGWLHWVSVTRAMIEYHMSHVKPTKRKIAACRDRKKAHVLALRPAISAPLANPNPDSLVWEWRDPYECVTWRPFSSEVSHQLEDATKNQIKQVSFHLYMGIHIGIGIGEDDCGQGGKAEQCIAFLASKRMTNVDQQMNYKIRRRKAPTPLQPK